MRKTEEVADTFPLYQAKLEDWHFIGVLAHSQNYFRRYSAFHIIYSLDVELAEPEQLTEKYIPLSKGIHAHYTASLQFAEHSDRVAEKKPQLLFKPLPEKTQSCSAYEKG